MHERPLLILPAPSAPARRQKKFGGGARLHLPSRDRQSTRLTPLFTSLQQVLEAQRLRMQTAATGLSPEEAVVMETVGPVDDFIVAVRGIAGLEWLGEIEEEDIPPDDDFFIAASDGVTRSDKKFRGRLFLIFTNQTALRQMISLWETWKAGNQLPQGLSKWGNLFSQLRDIRPWGINDRLEETGVLADWQERISHNESIIPCEIELWFHGNVSRRQSARNRVISLVTVLQGKVLHESSIEEIAYHALLVNLPIAAVQQVLGQTRRDVELVQCEQIQFFRATGQMAGKITTDTLTLDTTISTSSIQLGEPIVALFDGLPLQNHQRLAGRLVIDDPDGFESEYQPTERKHGTAMASLILHGDLDAGEQPLNRKLYVRPILYPDPHDWRGPTRAETAPEHKLLVDLMHRAVRRMFEGEGTESPTSPQVCVINLSIGIRDRLFDGALSPLARLLDWLAWKYSVLFIVSAGNHAQGIELTGVPYGQIGTLSPQQIQEHIIKAVAADVRHRRLLSPAEAVNIITVGAVHSDKSPDISDTRVIKPFVDHNLPSCINAQGMGYRRSIKPDILLPGGRMVFAEKLGTTTNTILDANMQGCAPGQRAACPGSIAGALNSTTYTRGTSNATALASRAASLIYDILDELGDPSTRTVIDDVPRALWIKTLLTHASSWGNAGDILEKILKTPQNSRQFKEYVTRLLGYGIVDFARVNDCTPFRVTALGGGQLQADQAHTHRLPLPPSLSGKQGLRRLIITLSWFTPISLTHQAWRRADLWFTPPSEPLDMARQEANYHAVQRGTVQHEILEGTRAAAFVDGDNLEILVSCRSGAGTLEETVPYSLAITLEVAEEIGIDIYNEIRVRVPATRISITPNG